MEALAPALRGGPASPQRAPQRAGGRWVYIAAASYLPVDASGADWDPDQGRHAPPGNACLASRTPRPDRTRSPPALDISPSPAGGDTGQHRRDCVARFDGPH